MDLVEKSVIFTGYGTVEKSQGQGFLPCPCMTDHHLTWEREFIPPKRF